MTARPKLRLLPKHGARAKAGSPWIFANEIVMDRATKANAPGTLVAVADDRSAEFAAAYFNPRSLIAARILSRDPKATIDSRHFRDRFEQADALRRKLVATTAYRLIHAEADDCPGLVIDRFDDVFVVQSGTAGMDVLKPIWLEALHEQFKPRAIVVKSNAASRSLEGLRDDVGVAHGPATVVAHVVEAGLRHEIDPLRGQKTGWFFDQRDNRAFLISLAKGATILDAYSYIGALALGAVKAGAKSAVLLDSSQAALDAAAKTAKANRLDERCEFRRCDVLEELEELGPADETFDIVVCDPPPFVRSKKDLESGARGYRKLARLAAQLVNPGGFLCLSSCSHAIGADRFAQECAQGVSRAGRVGRVIRATGAAPDHPVHPLLPETAYLKSIVFQLD